MPKVSIDMQLPLVYVTEELIEELELLEPFGKGNTKPLFAEKNLKVQNLRVIGKNQNVLKFQVLDRNGRKNGGDLFRRGTGVYGVSAGKRRGGADILSVGQ